MCPAPMPERSRRGYYLCPTCCRTLPSLARVNGVISTLLCTQTVLPRQAQTVSLLTRLERRSIRPIPPSFRQYAASQLLITR